MSPVQFPALASQLAGDVGTFVREWAKPAGGPLTVPGPLPRRTSARTIPPRPANAVSDGIAGRGSVIGRGVVVTQVRFLPNPLVVPDRRRRSGPAALQGFGPSAVRLVIRRGGLQSMKDASWTG